MTVDPIWFKGYPEGVPHTIEPDAYRSLVDMFLQTCETFQDKAAFANFKKELSFNDMRRLATDFAAYLQHDLKMKKGDRIALMMPNCLQYPIAMFGALMAGCVVVNINPLYTVHELVHQLNDARPETVVVIANTASVLEHALPKVNVKNIVVSHLGDMLPCFKRLLINFAVKHIKKMVPEYSLAGAVSFRKILKKGSKLTFRPVALNNSDLAFLQYTGGTTGLAKGAMLTHRNLIANVLQCEAWMKPVCSDPSKELIITALPLYHIFSLTCNCLTFFKIGAFNVLITNPRDMHSFVKELSEYRFSAITAVNTLFNALVNYPAFRRLDFSSLRLSLAGGMALQSRVAREWKEVTGNAIIEGYGLTESSPVLTISPVTQQAFSGSIGLPLPSTTICIRDDEGNPCELGEPGELTAKGPQVMSGYWEKSDETADVIKDGWLYTGDIALMDESGMLRIVDRKKDMIVVSGFNVYPNEVEDVIATVPGVSEVAVIGVPNEQSGEMVKAVVVTKESEEVTKEDIINVCRENLTRYKIPKEIEFRDSLPKSNVGKILRRALR